MLGAAGLFVFTLTAQNLPDGPGKQAVQQVCTKCHDLGQALDRKRTGMEWGATVDKMVTQGAEMTPEQMNSILDYLVTNFRKPVNLNSAKASVLEGEFDFSEKEAEAIIA